MQFIDKINIVTVVTVTIFLLPLVSGALKPFSKERILYSLESLLNNLEFLVGLLLSIYLTKKIFFENETGIFKRIYEVIPSEIKSLFYGRDILAYIISVPVLLIVVLLILRFITNLLFRLIIVPLSDGLYTGVNSLGRVGQSLIGALWQLPKSVYLVFILGLIVNFYTYYFYAPELGRQLNESKAYQLLYRNALQPVLNSNIAKQIPVIVNDSFRKSVDGLVPQRTLPSPEQFVKQLSNGNLRVIEYFNGVTLDEAINSNNEIDETAKKIVGEEKNSRKKAYLLYKWISQNVKYDYDKVTKVSTNPRGVSSGSIEAYNTRKGICFDYSCLYVSMCRAVGLKVRLVTGLAYSGVSWGDHAWNQVYSVEENRWINVDATFGTTANYYDKADFEVDHRYDDVQGEW